MMRLFTAILFFTLIFGAQYTSAADVSRLRLMIPVSASNEAELASTNTQESYDPSGYNLNYVTGSGLGLGYTSTTIVNGINYVESTTTIEFKSTFTQTFFDLSYTVGSELTAQFVLGYQIGQSDGEREYSGKSETTTVDSYHGSAWAINAGYDFGGVEALVGYRSEFTSADITTADGVKRHGWIKSKIVSAGFGLTF
ncbi:MAG: hypothetical protein P8O70_16365 [SAR324 cluster bacterium]|nr:hypothetical protein [SAR324 cluster bacterium]